MKTKIYSLLALLPLMFSSNLFSQDEEKAPEMNPEDADMQEVKEDDASENRIDFTTLFMGDSIAEETEPVISDDEEKDKEKEEKKEDEVKETFLRNFR